MIWIVTYEKKNCYILLWLLILLYFVDYIFDGHENDNIRWMNNDIAVVKMEDEFDFTRRVRGCDYIPRPICYNNQSIKNEEPGQEANVIGWGSTNKYNDVSWQ